MSLHWLSQPNGSYKICCSNQIGCFETQTHEAKLKLKVKKLYKQLVSSKVLLTDEKFNSKSCLRPLLTHLASLIIISIALMCNILYINHI